MFEDNFNVMQRLGRVLMFDLNPIVLESGWLGALAVFTLSWLHSRGFIQECGNRRD